MPGATRCGTCGAPLSSTAVARPPHRTNRAPAAVAGARSAFRTEPRSLVLGYGEEHAQQGEQHQGQRGDGGAESAVEEEPQWQYRVARASARRWSGCIVTSGSAYGRLARWHRERERVGCTNSISREWAPISVGERPGRGVMPTRRWRLGGADRRCGFEVRVMA